MNKIFLIGLFVIAVVYVALVSLFPCYMLIILIGAVVAVSGLMWYVVTKSEVPKVEEDTDVKFRRDEE